MNFKEDESMNNISKFCEKYLKGKSIDYKMAFAKKLIESNKIGINNAYSMIDYIVFEDYRPTDREISMDEIHYLYSLVSDKALEIELQKPNYGISEKEISMQLESFNIEDEEEFFQKLEEKRKNFYIKRGVNV